MSEVYDLQQKLQELAAMSNVSLRNFKSLHHVSYVTLYKFLKEPSLVRPRTLTSVRLICEFLSSALKARVLPLPKDDDVDVCDAISVLYDRWWNNGKKFPERVDGEVANGGENITGTET
jgi:hypothetical protein